MFIFSIYVNSMTPGLQQQYLKTAHIKWLGILQCSRCPSCKQGHAVLKEDEKAKILRPLRHLETVKNAAETAAEKSMSKSADEVKTFYEPEEDNVYNIGISGDGA